MTAREIIAEAWAITRKEKALRRWGIASAFLQTLLDLKLIGYQVYFLWEHLAGRQAGFWDVEVMLYHSVPLWFFLTLAITFLLMVVIEFFFPHMALGAIIGLSAKSYRNEPVKGGLVLALYNFFPIFAIHEIFFLSRLATVITIGSLVLRYVPDLRWPIITGLVALWLLSSILRFIFSFAEEAVVIRKVSVFAALGQSFKLIVSYLGHVMLLMLLLFVISIRIVINMLTVLVIPAITIGVGYLLATFLSTTISTVFATLIGITLVFAASYFFGHLNVFKEAVWTITYIELSKRKELDVIES